MSLSITNRGSGAHNTGAASFTLSPGSNFAAGATAVLCVAADNSSAGGATNDFTTVTDSLGNTWTKRQSPVFDNGAASAGVQGAIFDSEQNVGTLTTSTVITVSFGSSPVAKSWTLTEVAPAAGKIARFRAGADKSAGATATIMTLGASPSVNVGEVVVGAIYMESGTSQSVSTPDSDTTNGIWTTNQYAEVGSTQAGSCIVSQAKLQTTAASTQTYNVTVGASSDYHGSYAIYQELNVYLLSAASGAYVETDTPASLLAARLLLVASGTYSVTDSDATIAEGHLLPVESGLYSTTGTDVGLVATRYLPVSSGTYLETFEGASLREDRVLLAEPTAYSAVDADAGLARGYTLLATPDALAVSGADVQLVAARDLIISGGSLSLTGESIGITVVFGAGPSTWLLDGSDVAIQRPQAIVMATSGDFEVASANVGLCRRRLLGSDVTFRLGSSLFAESSVVEFDGADAALRRHRHLFTVSGTFYWHGMNLGSNRDLHTVIHRSINDTVLDIALYRNNFIR